MLNLPNSANAPNTLAFEAIGMDETILATLLADTRVDLHHLHSITKRAGYVSDQ